ncbi:MAG TPA: FecR family protein [Lutibacter sp.]
MKPEKVDAIIIKLIEDNISDKEAEFLTKWMENEKNKSYFDEFIEINYLINAKNNFDYIRSLKKTKGLINRKSNNNYWPFLKYAAIFIVFIGVGYFFINRNITPDVSENQLIIAEDDITVELENGNVKVISSNGDQKLVNKAGEVIAEQSGNKLNYEKENNSEEFAYNTIKIPNGKKFKIILSDGTEVDLNSGTVLKYPTKFIKGINRQVDLLEGEAYFNVTKDTEHPFVVNLNNINVRVLGTEFNVSSYPEDKVINTVLVEGAVSIFGSDKTYDKATSLELKPGFRASWEKTNKTVSIDKVDTSIYTGWKNGKLIFKNTQFKNIIKKLERHYNVSIINNNSHLDEQYFDATFDVETLEQVLNAFNKSYTFQYILKNNQIIINQSKNS